MLCTAPRRTPLRSTEPWPAVTEPRDTRAPIAQAFAWASRITGIALEMVLPGALGYWIDQHLGTRFVFLILGTVFGVVSGMVQLVRLAKPQDNQAGKDKGSETSGRSR